MLEVGQAGPAGGMGGTNSEVSVLTAVFKSAVSPEQSSAAMTKQNAGGGGGGVQKGELGINQSCDAMLSEQLSHLREIHVSLEEALSELEESPHSAEAANRAKDLYEQAQHSTVLVSCIGKMQNELLHSRRDLQKSLLASAEEVVTIKLETQERTQTTQDRVRWLENRLEQVLLLHRRSIAEAAADRESKETAAEKDGGAVVDGGKEGKIVNIGSLPDGPKSPSTKDQDTTCTSKSVKSQKAASTTTTTRFTVPSTSKSEDALYSDGSIWGSLSPTRRRQTNALWHTLPLVPRSPIQISCGEFDKEVPWLDRRGSSYDLLRFQREEYSELVERIGRVYSHINTVVDSSHEAHVSLTTPSNAKPASRMSRIAGETKNDLECYGLESPKPTKWSRMIRNPSNVYPRPTRTWHKGVYLEPVRRIATQQQQPGSRASTAASGHKPPSSRAFDRSKLLRAKNKVLTSLSLVRLNKTAAAIRHAEMAATGILEAQDQRIEFLIESGLQSEVAKIRKESARDLGILYKTRPNYDAINALKQTVYTDDNIFVLIEASRALLSIGVWDAAALEILLQGMKYGSVDLRCSLLETLRSSKNPHLVNKQSIQFKILQTLLLALVSKGSHNLRSADSSPRFQIGRDPESLSLVCGGTPAPANAENDSLASRAALTCAYFDIRDSPVQESLEHFLREGDEDMKCWCLEALVRSLKCHTEEVVRSCLRQISAARRWENRQTAINLIVDLKGAIEKFGLSQMVFEGLENKLHDECSRDVRKSAARVISELGLHQKMMSVVIRKLDDINEDVRAQGVMSISVLGIKGKSLLNQLLDILELDSSIFVRIQVMRAVKELRMHDRRVLRLLRERARGTGPMCLEAQVSLYSLTGETE